MGHTGNDVAQKTAYCVNRIAKMWLFYNRSTGMRSRFWSSISDCFAKKTKAKRLRMFPEAITDKSMIGTGFAVLSSEKKQMVPMGRAISMVTGRTFTEEGGLL